MELLQSPHLNNYTNVSLYAFYIWRFINIIKCNGKPLLLWLYKNLKNLQNIMKNYKRKTSC